LLVGGNSGKSETTVKSCAPGKASDEKEENDPEDKCPDPPNFPSTAEQAGKPQTDAVSNVVLEKRDDRLQTEKNKNIAVGVFSRGLLFYDQRSLRPTPWWQSAWGGDGTPTGTT